MSKLNDHILLVLVVIYTFVVITSITVLIFPDFVEYVTSRASSGTASISICLNEAPENLTHNCLAVAISGDLYTCDINATDDYGGSSISYSSNLDFYDINSSTGAISFTPNNNNIGTYTVNLTATDDVANCNLSASTVYTLFVVSGGGSSGSGGAAAPSSTSMKLTADSIEMQQTDHAINNIIIENTGESTLRSLNTSIAESTDGLEVRIAQGYFTSLAPGQNATTVLEINTNSAEPGDYLITIYVESKSPKYSQSASFLVKILNPVSAEALEPLAEEKIAPFTSPAQIIDKVIPANASPQKVAGIAVTITISTISVGYVLWKLWKKGKLFK